MGKLDSENIGLEAFVSEFLELVECYTISDDVEHYESTRLTPLWEINKDVGLGTHAGQNPNVQNLAPESRNILRDIPASASVAEGEVCLVRGSEDFANFKPQSILVA